MLSHYRPPTVVFTCTACLEIPWGSIRYQWDAACPESVSLSSRLTQPSSSKERLGRQKKIRSDAFFSCMRGRLLYSANANSFYRSGESEFPLGGREKKLSSISFPTQLPSRAIPTLNKKGAKLSSWPRLTAPLFRV